ncbi:hypothetical protein [Streptomyces rubiginosohelvolus]|uniref:Uncharacterized protein n=1 Tax=Streptomyces rubiginosohelvolus TaxID=67362 RepID=A0ABQ3CBW5_9ACTN|nr:hypothetical protein [Streptomyces pluricolorescens]GGZ82716.1 hypothetical protein GCM10010328_66420 [Streptomyces pluricolorescens]
MTGTEFRAQHGDPTTWTTADIETQQNLAACDALPDDIKAAADRLRQLLAPAA